MAKDAANHACGDRNPKRYGGRAIWGKQPTVSLVAVLRLYATLGLPRL